ncbi:hypothetical protein DNHGIG_01770 [Collibacillus ludicampi]|uniref:Aminoglycoside phosphotransferase domain-containing protein n=1 Tax=Collibacillus ludicampi TaxID=2771369 RepID=A0AAV4LAD6_9BACL|nr:hypothetical protein [Collibacillus ludicampi]GIM44628.1 hypothetical protein DNHGIG_01770 [Collibacillus ludicampi]
MVAAMDDITRSVLPRYEIEVNGIEPIGKGLYRVDTDRGGKWLHEHEDMEAVQLRFAVTEHLANHCFRRIPRFIRTLHGDPYVRSGERVYTLTDEWAGRQPEYITSDLRLAAVNLAELHSALCAGDLNMDRCIPQRHGTWAQAFKRCRDHVASIVSSWNSIGNRDDFQEVFLNYAPWLSEVMDESIETLEKGGYDAVAREHQERNSICFGEYRLEHLRITGEGKVATLSFDTIAGDMPLYDVARFCHILLEEGKGVFIPSVLSNYEEVRKLDEEEKAIVKGYLSFPHSVYRIITAYLQLSRPQDRFVGLLQQAVDRWRMNQPFILGAFRYETS